MVATIKRRGLGQIADYLFFLRLRMPTALLGGVVLGAPIWLNIDVPAAHYIAGVSLLAITYGAAINYHVTGMWIVALGTGANLIVLLANGAIPVDAGALAAAGVLDNATIDQVVFGTGRQLATDGDYLGWLGAVIGVRALGDAITFGDLITAAGLANVTFRLAWPLGSSLDRVLPPPVEKPADDLADYASDLARPDDATAREAQPDEPLVDQPPLDLEGPPPAQPGPAQPALQPLLQPAMSYSDIVDSSPDTAQLAPAAPAAEHEAPAAPSAAPAPPIPAAHHADERTQLISTIRPIDSPPGLSTAASASNQPG